MRFTCVLAISSGVLAKNPEPRRLNTELVQFMDDGLYENFDEHKEYVRHLAVQSPHDEAQDGLGGMRNFGAEKGYANHNNAAEVAAEESIALPKKLPFTLEDLKQPETKAPTVDDEEAAGKPFIEREDGVNEVNYIQTEGMNIDALL